MAIYMKYGSIAGAVTTKGFENWIELSSFQWAATRSIRSATRSSLGRETSEPIIGQITVSKNTDRASTKLFQEATGGDLSAEVTLKFTTTTKNAVTTYLTYVLSNTGLTRYSMSCSGEKPTETLSLNCTKIMMTYSELDPRTQGKPDTVGYDLTKMSKV